MSANSLRGVSSALRDYLRDNKLPDVYEALLSGLCVMCPEDHLSFIIDKMNYLVSNGLDNLRWDMFIEDDMKPSAHIIPESSVESMFDFDAALNPSPEQSAIAYQFYNESMMKKCFNALLQHYLRRKQKHIIQLMREQHAEYHYKYTEMTRYFNIWKRWRKYRKGRQNMAFQKIRRAHCLVFGRVIFEAWLDHTRDAKKTREYFEILIKSEKAMLDTSEDYQAESQAKLERGDNLEDDMASISHASLITGEALDSLSALPKPVAVKMIYNSISHENSTQERPDFDQMSEIKERESLNYLRAIAYYVPESVKKCNIFSYLDVSDLARCAVVCRSWKILSQASNLWSRIDLSKVKKSAKQDVIHKMLARSRPYVVHLNLRGCGHCLSSKTFVCLRECRNIQDLNLSECDTLVDEKFMLLYNGCRVLLYLNLSYTQIGDISLRMISQCFNSLQYISLAYCHNFTDVGMDYLSIGICKRYMKYVDLSGCNQLTPQGYRFLTRFENMESLILNDIDTLNDDCVMAVFEKCYKLTYVSLIDSPLLTDDAFKKLAANKRLSKIKIESDLKISDSTLRAFGKQCLNLTHLYITNNQRITDISLKTIATCRSLIVIDLADCLRVSDTGVRYIAEGACGPVLRELNLTNCIRVGDMAVINIHKRCHSLTYLTLCYCQHISEAGVELCGQMQNLVSLDISGCFCTDHGLSSLGGHLKDLSISECVSVSDLGLQKFAQQSPNIDRLDLSFCMQLSDAAMKNLAFCCRLLSVLNIEGCKFLTDMSIQYLSGVCKYLSHLDISGCTLLTDKSVKYLKKGCLYLKVLRMLYCRGITKVAVSKLSNIDLVEYNGQETPNEYAYKERKF